MTIYTMPQAIEKIVQIEEKLPTTAEIVPQATGAAVQIADTVQRVIALGIDWNEIIYVLVGAVIGFLGSIGVLFAERALDKKGAIQIFYRRTNQRGTKRSGWGFDETGDGRLFLTIPITFEIQNTTNTTRVIRDVSLLLYAGNTFVAKMYQSAGKHITHRRNGEITGEEDYKFGTEKGSYSFVLPPRSIQRQECEYSYVIYVNEQKDKYFDTIIARYYDEQNKAHTFKVMSVDNAWAKNCFDPDEEWLVLKK